MFFLGSATTGCHLDMDIELARLDSAYVNSWRYIPSWFGWCMIRALFHSNCGSQSYGLSLFCRSNAIESQTSCRNPKERELERWSHGERVSKLYSHWLNHTDFKRVLRTSPLREGSPASYLPLALVVKLSGA